MKPKFKVGDKVRCIDASTYATKITNGKEYEVHSVREDIIEVRGDDHRLNEWYSRRFELIEENMETELTLARKLVGKQISFRDQPVYTVQNVGIYLREDLGTDRFMVRLVKDHAQEYGYCVYVTGETRGGNFYYPVTLVKEFTGVTIKLNDNHDAVVTKKEIKVGCQTFTPEVIKELYNTLIKLEKE